MPDLDLDRWEELCAGATAGPWTATDEIPRAGWVVDANDAVVALDLRCKDAAFIAAAREALPALIKRVRELEGALIEIASDRSREHGQPQIARSDFGHGYDAACRHHAKLARAALKDSGQ
jgi:hypothetical protein